MNREKAIKLYEELQSMCPGLILSGSVIRGKQEDINCLNLILVCNIFPLHILPIGHMDSTPKLESSEMLRFSYKGEQVDIYRTTEENLGAMKLYLTGPIECDIYLRSIAHKKGMRLNQNGLFKGKKCIASKTEEEIFEKLGLKYISPEKRDCFRSIKL